MTDKAVEPTPSLEAVLEDLKADADRADMAACRSAFECEPQWRIARRGDIEVFRAGRHLKVLSAPLRRKLGIEDARCW
jgi:hypothetical protein